MFLQFLFYLKHYLFEIIPALIIGFLISGIINEFVPQDWIKRNLGTKGIKPVLYSTIVGAIVPVCCWGSLPLAVTFYSKGASLGPVIAFLIATPATSINSFIVVWKFFGLQFALYVVFSVILMGVASGMIANLFRFKPKFSVNNEVCMCCKKEIEYKIVKKKFFDRVKSILKYAYYDLPKEIGLETFLGLVLAAIVSTITPIGVWIRSYLIGVYGYIFSIMFGLLMYMCATMSVPLVYALVNQGLSIGAGLTLLLIGPITSYGTILVIKKEFGFKVLLFYLCSICVGALFFGYLYSFLSIYIRFF